LTRLGGGGYGSRPLARRIRTAALLLLSVAAACHDSAVSVPPTFDRFYYPTGLAVRRNCTTPGSCQTLPDGSCIAGTTGCQSELLVASSNFDLRYDPATGGTVLQVDVDRALAGDASAAAGPFADGAVLGTARMGSFAGDVAVVDAVTCPGWQSAPQVLVTSREANALFRLDVGVDGSLSCGAGCVLPLPSGLADPYGVTVVCGDLAPAEGGGAAPRHLAFVTYLQAANSQGVVSEGFVSRVDLDTGAIEASYDLGAGPTQTTVRDAARGLLFVSERFSTVGVARLRWIDLAFPQLASGAVDYGQIVRGAELVTLALSSDTPPSRAYVAARLYDVDTATSSGTRPVGDVGGALLVLDLERVLGGAPVADTVVRVVPLGRGPTALVAIPRRDLAGKPLLDAAGNPLRDLVAVTSSDDGSMTIYDDQIGQPAVVFSFCGSNPALDALAPAPCPGGNPSLGQQPFGVAYEPYQNGGKALARLFVGSFDRSWVNALVLDPAHPALPLSWARIGPERK
jgi:hypothetical protein